MISGSTSAQLPTSPTETARFCAVFLGVEVERGRIEKRIRTGYCDRLALDLDEALRICEDAAERKRAVSVGLVGNCAEVLPELVRRGVKVDAVTDQTSAHDPLNGYVPAGLSPDEAEELRRSDPRGYVGRSTASLQDVIQTDAAISSGSSGGVLVDRAGMVVGLTTEALVGDPSVSVEDIAFAIPSERVTAVLSEMGLVVPPTDAPPGPPR